MESPGEHQLCGLLDLARGYICLQHQGVEVAEDPWHDEREDRNQGFGPVSKPPPEDVEEAQKYQGDHRGHDQRAEGAQAEGGRCEGQG